jgi:hypothetical protein
MAIMAEEYGVTDGDPSHTIHSYSDYPTRPDRDHFCSPTNLSVAEQHLPEFAYEDEQGNMQTSPEQHVRYQWNDLRVYVTFATQGTAATGEVTITDEIAGCTATYLASALYPAVGCELLDAEGNGTGIPDDLACCANADPDRGRAFGSGISPDLKVKCDPDLFLCVLDWKPGEAFPPTGKNPGCGTSE